MSLVGENQGFGLWANSGGSVRANRNFNVPMKTNDLFSIRMDNNWISPGGQVGFALSDANGVERLKFYFVGGETNYRIQDGRGEGITSWPWSDAGFRVLVKLNPSPSQTYQLGISTNVGSTNWISNTNLASGGAITQLSLICQNPAGSTPPNERPQHDVFFGEIIHERVSEETGSIQVATAGITYNSLTDGLPNEWWATHFGQDYLNLGVSAGDDSDGDGFTNAQEYALGTLPLDPASSLRVEGTQRSGDHLSVTWTSVFGKKYRIQGKSSLASPVWEDLDPIIDAWPDGSTTALVPIHETSYFFRIILVP